ncbi:MAG TPA: dihydrofolate reductase family protein [Candidatus Saccharimonadales bacterium]|nr:dihydrofolate reductase family protein [Candidatus Saccharimonadales bacterium]
MRKIFLFMMVTLDGYFEGPGHDLSWHNVDAEFNDFAIPQMLEADTILFGKRTYQLMEEFWPSPAGLEGDPEVADIMNNTPKVVVSTSLKNIKETEHWKNVRLIEHNVKEELQKLKEQDGKDIILLGSSTLSVSLLSWGLLDEIRIMTNPVAIGEGTTLFHGLKKKIKFHLMQERTFQSGNVLLTYHVKN